MNNLCEDLNRV